MVFLIKGSGVRVFFNKREQSDGLFNKREQSDGFLIKGSGVMVFFNKREQSDFLIKGSRVMGSVMMSAPKIHSGQFLYLAFTFHRMNEVLHFSIFSMGRRFPLQFFQYPKLVIITIPKNQMSQTNLEKIRPNAIMNFSCKNFFCKDKIWRKL